MTCNEMLALIKNTIHLPWRQIVLFCTPPFEPRTRSEFIRQIAQFLTDSLSRAQHCSPMCEQSTLGPRSQSRITTEFFNILSTSPPSPWLLLSAERMPRRTRERVPRNQRRKYQLVPRSIPRVPFRARSTLRFRKLTIDSLDIIPMSSCLACLPLDLQLMIF